jgi:membrane-bound ClpP family serine protease
VTPLIWGLALLGLSLLLVLVEVFVPSGGIISIAAALVAVAGLVGLYMHDLTWGLSGTLFLLILTPIVIAFGIKVWTTSRVGRAMMGVPSEEEVERRREAEQARRDARLVLLGAEGVALNDLRPIGVIEIDGQRYDASSETGLVRRGARVRVTHVTDFDMKVREIV